MSPPHVFPSPALIINTVRIHVEHGQTRPLTTHMPRARDARKVGGGECWLGSSCGNRPRRQWSSASVTLDCTASDHECTYRRKVHSNRFLDVVEEHAALPGHDTRLPLSVCEGRLERTPWSNEPHRVLAHHVVIRFRWVRVQGNRITPLTCVVQLTRRDKAHQGVRCERDMIGRLSLDKSTRRCVRQ